MDYNTLLNNLKEDSSLGHSSLNLRNESLQESAGGRVPKFKWDKGKICRMLFTTDIALPFNPFTGVADEEYNSSNMFRPEHSAETVVKAIKAHYKQDPTNLETFLKTVNAPSWDVSNPENITEEDFNIFYKYRKIRTFTHEVIGIRSKILNRTDYNVPYRVNFERDEFEEIVGEYPKILEIKDFYMTVYMEEFAKWKKDNPSATSKEEAEAFRNFSEKVPVTNIYKQNSLLAVSLPLSNLKPDFSNMTPEEMKKSLVTLKRSKGIKESLESMLTTYRETHDHKLNFIELDFLISNDDSDGLRVQSSKFNTATHTSESQSDFAKMNSSLSECLDSFKKQEERVTSTMAPKAVNDLIVDKLCQALATEIPYESIEHLITDNTANRYSAIMSAIYGDSCDDAITAAIVGDAPAALADQKLIDQANKAIQQIQEDSAEAEEIPEIEM